MRKVLILLALSLPMLVSCHRQAVKGRDAIALVYDIVTGSDQNGSRIIRENGIPSKDGEIYVAGSPGLTEELTARFLACDIRDNVRGRDFSDGLRDFAGETISGISDPSFTPYSRFSDSPDSLRELTVRYVLAALDKRCNVSVYDLDGNAAKSPAKLIVLADPWLLRYGKFDADTLMTLSGAGVPVISPQKLMFDAVMAGEVKAFNIGVICDSAYVGTGIYPELFRAATRANGIVGADFMEGSGSLYDFLDAYLAAGRTEPLDAILVDDISADMDALDKQLQSVRNYSREEYMKYGKYVSPSLRLVSSATLTMDECYDILRSRHLFTHKIAQPFARKYVVKPRPWSDDMQFLLIPE